MKEGNEKKNTGGRPKKTFKKDVILRIRVDRQDLFILREKARLSGASLSKYIREAAVNGGVVRARLTNEQMAFIRQFAGVGNNLNQVVKEFNKAGMMKAAVHFQETASRIDELLKFLKNDKQSI